MLYNVIPYILNSNTSSPTLYKEILARKYTYIFLYLEIAVTKYFYNIVKSETLLRIIRLIVVNEIYYAYITN